MDIKKATKLEAQIRKLKKNDFAFYLSLPATEDTYRVFHEGAGEELTEKEIEDLQIDKTIILSEESLD